MGDRTTNLSAGSQTAYLLDCPSQMFGWQTNQQPRIQTPSRGFLKGRNPHLDVLHGPLHRVGHAPLTAPLPVAVGVQPQVADHQVEVVSCQPPQVEGRGGGPHLGHAEPSPLQLRRLLGQPGGKTGGPKGTQNSDCGSEIYYSRSIMT